MILVSCNNIWTQLVDKICCRFNKSVVGAFNSMAVGGANNNNPSFAQLLSGANGNANNNDFGYNPHVMTLYATPNGDLQLRLPNATVITQPPAQMVQSIRNNEENEEFNERIIYRKNKNIFQHPSTQICTDTECSSSDCNVYNNGNNLIKNEKNNKGKNLNFGKIKEEGEEVEVINKKKLRDNQNKISMKNKENTTKIPKRQPSARRKPLQQQKRIVVTKRQLTNY
ncbi:unnamed protein product [Meloidogyne enterolobii]|uniref:Uncharacterized protein n=1 Tax=Meloidogyne enterolobii TaxID=390850 RepID=A0ACB0Z4K9_MELEN